MEQPHDELHLAIGGQDHKPLVVGDYDHHAINDADELEMAGGCEKTKRDPDLAKVCFPGDVRSGWAH